MTRIAKVTVLASSVVMLFGVTCALGRMYLANTLYEHGVLCYADRPHEAIRYFEAATILASAHPSAWGRLCALYQLDGRDRMAEKACRKQLDINPSDVYFQLLGNVLRAEKDFAGAAAAYAEVVKRVPDECGGYSSLAEALTRQGKADAAIGVLTDGIARNKEEKCYVECEQLGQLLISLQRFAEAEVPLKCALKSDTAVGRGVLSLQLGYIYELQGNDRAAQRLYHQANPHLSVSEPLSCLPRSGSTFEIHNCSVRIDKQLAQTTKIKQAVR